MSGGSIFAYEKRAFRVALAVTVIGHGLVALGLGWAGGNRPAEVFRPLAVVEFARFDPDGGEPGGGFGETPAGGSEEEVQAVEEATEDMERPEPETVPPPAPEPPPEPEPLSGLIESRSEQTAPTPQEQPRLRDDPPPQERPKKQPKAKTAKPAGNPGEVDSSKGEGPPGPAAGGGPGHGQGGLDGGGLGNPDALKAYASKVRRQLERCKKYPPAALAHKISGQAVVSFTLNRQGVILSSVLARSSGQAVLDEEIMALLKRVSPLPPIPQELPQAVLALTIPINFSVR